MRLFVDPSVRRLGVAAVSRGWLVRIARARALLFALAVLFVGCTGKNPDYCERTSDCPWGKICIEKQNRCQPASPADASTPEISFASGDLPLPTRSDAGIPVRDSSAPARDNSAPARDSTAPARDSAIGSLDTTETRLPNGYGCHSGVECQSGSCVDGVCCEGVCDGVCVACNQAGNEGRCMPLAAGLDPANECKGTDSACGGSCDGKGGCAFASPATSCATLSCSSATLSAGSCDGKGGCAKTATSCGAYGCADATSCRTSCDTSGDCASGYECIDKKCVRDLAPGARCGTNGKACLSGFCVDGVCCDSAGCGACNRCDLGGKQGSCNPVTDGTGCGTEVCSGELLSHFSCASGSCKETKAACGAYFACSGDGKNCRGSCSSASDCAASAYCDAASTTCRLKVLNGLACSADGQCQTGICTTKERVCCDRRCEGECERCSGLAKCSYKPKATPCGVGSPDCKDSGFYSAIVTESCSGAAASCSSTKLDCGAYHCGPSRTCKTSCASHDECNSGFCEQSKCVPGTEVCVVDAKASDAASQLGSAEFPFASVADCFKQPWHRETIVVRPGRYTKGWGFKVSGKTRIVALGVTATILEEQDKVIFDLSASAQAYAIGFESGAELSIYGAIFEDTSKTKKITAIDTTGGTLIYDGVHDVAGFAHPGFFGLSGRPLSGSGKVDLRRVSVHGNGLGILLSQSPTVKFTNVDILESPASEISGASTTVTMDGLRIALDAKNGSAGGLQIYRAAVTASALGVAYTGRGLQLVDVKGGLANLISWQNRVTTVISTAGNSSEGLYVSNALVYQEAKYGSALRAGVGAWHNIAGQSIYLRPVPTHFSNSIVHYLGSGQPALAWDGDGCNFYYSNVRGGGSLGNGNFELAPTFYAGDLPGFCWPTNPWCLAMQNPTDGRHKDKGTNRPLGFVEGGGGPVVHLLLPETDFWGQKRIVGGTVDIGPHERQD